MTTPLLQAAELRLIERRHAHLDLMSRAGCAAANRASSLLRDNGHPVLVLAGPGNNGGDAFDMASRLRQHCYRVHVVFPGDPLALPPDAAQAYQRFLASGGLPENTIPLDVHWALIVDGIFGIGLSRAPAAPYAELISTANHLAKRDRCALLALDCPSGLNADTGHAYAPCISASHTLTFIADKPGLHTLEGPDHCGEISVADLGLTREANLESAIRLLDIHDFSDHLQPRRRNAHKGTFGSAGILGGAPGMVGAALLAARAAINLGAGRVYLGMLDTNAPTVDPIQPEIMIRPADQLQEAELQVIACGPGLGQSDQALTLLDAILATPLPVVLDADALNLLAAHPVLADVLPKRAAKTIMTPHPAEAARLLNTTVADIQLDRVAAARLLARRYSSSVALKGCGTVVVTCNGETFINPTGNPGMATAGMGDVLTGMIAALIAQGWPAEQALMAGVHLHGAAADCLVAQGTGPVGMTAGEVVGPARALFNAWLDRDTAY